MDVLHVIHQFPPESRGGSESYVFDLAQRQRARGRDVHVLSGSKVWRNDVTLEDGLVEGLPVHRLHRDDLYLDAEILELELDEPRHRLERFRRVSGLARRRVVE